MSASEKSAFLGLRCTECQKTFGRNEIVGLCSNCGSPLDTILDEEVLKNLRRDSLSETTSSMWKFRAFLPVEQTSRLITAGEGGTPLRPLPSFRGKAWLKDETRNPTGTFKDRGAALTITAAVRLGVKQLALSSEGNAGCSFALYSQMAGLRCTIFLPNLVNKSKVVLSRKLGARVKQVPGTMADAGRHASLFAAQRGAYNVSTFVTPYRHDGKGTMALEICEQLGWRSPDWVVYPIGGGVGLIGMWKMFKILEKIGWVEGIPRLVGVQPKGCAPVVKAFNAGREEVQEWPSPATSALGLKIPKPLAGPWILRSLKESKGAARTVSEDQIRQSVKQLAKKEGAILEPSSAAAFAVLPALYKERIVDSSETVVVVGTGSGLKTLESL